MRCSAIPAGNGTGSRARTTDTGSRHEGAACTAKGIHLSIRGLQAPAPRGGWRSSPLSPTRISTRRTWKRRSLTAMTGELWVDAAEERVTRLEGHLQRDIDFGWGILGTAEQGRMDRDRASRRGRAPMAHRALSDGDERASALQDQIPLTRAGDDSIYAGSCRLGYAQAIQMLRSELRG